MLEGHPQPRRESRYNTEMHKDYIVEREGLFQPDGKYLEKSAGVYLRRLEEKLEPLPNAPDLQKQQAEWAAAAIKRWRPELEEQGWVGVAKAHSLFAAFDLVQREASTKGATAYISSPYNGSNEPVLEVLLSVPPEVLEDDSSRELWAKEFVETTLSATDRLSSYLDKS